LSKAVWALLAHLVGVLQVGARGHVLVGLGPRGPIGLVARVLLLLPSPLDLGEGPGLLLEETEVLAPGGLAVRRLLAGAASGHLLDLIGPVLAVDALYDGHGLLLGH